MHSNPLPALLALAAGLALSVPVAASTSDQAPSSLCGGDHDKKKKDVKKPAPGDDKKPTNPASADTQCGGDHDKKKKDVKKPAPGDDKKPTNPA